jgi:hypothetical protein
MFGSPGDVASLIGREYLSQEVTRSNSAASQRDKLKPLVLSYTITPNGRLNHIVQRKQYLPINLWNQNQLQLKLQMVKL